MTYEIREICPADDPHIATIIRESLKEFGANRPGFAWADPELDRLSQAYVHPKAVYYVVTVDGTVVGGGGIAPFPCGQAGMCELQKMYLSPAHRGQGLGKTLMQKLLEVSASYQYRGCYLETFNKMDAAIRLYQKLGFEQLDRPFGDSGHNSCDRYFVYWFESNRDRSL